MTAPILSKLVSFFKPSAAAPANSDLKAAIEQAKRALGACQAAVGSAEFLGITFTPDQVKEHIAYLEGAQDVLRPLVGNNKEASTMLTNLDNHITSLTASLEGSNHHEQGSPRQFAKAII